MKRYSIADARKDLPSLVRAVEKGEKVQLTRHGQPVAVLLSTDEYAARFGERPDLWVALQSFRAEADLDALDVEQVYQDVRDRTPGRDFSL